MAIADIFSKRQRRARGEVLDTYCYDQINPTLRMQILYAVQDAIGTRDHALRNSDVEESYEFVASTLRREYGTKSLSARANSPFDEITNFFLEVDNVEHVLDALELFCRVIDHWTRRHSYLYRQNANDVADEAIDEINARLKEHGVGFRFENGEIIRVDSELIHSEVVKPALRLLNGSAYAGPQEEFLSAHEHYRHGNNKEALVDCLKAFESTMKAICDKRGWERDPNATASQLIKLLFEKGLIPTFWQTQINSLKSSLESAVPTGRNKLAGHGQGSEPVAVPNYLAGYMLHMTASTILFLVEAEASI